MIKRPQPGALFSPSCIACLLTLSLGGAASAANIITNPGFELGVATDATDWNQLSGAAGSTTRSLSMPRTGVASIYMEVDHVNNTPAPGAYFAEQNQPVGSIDNSLNYNLSLYAKSATLDFTGVDMFYQILWLDQDGSDGGGVKGESLVQLVTGGINTSYQQFGLSDIDVPDGTDSFLLRFQLSAGPVAGIQNGLFVDDVSLEAIPEPSAVVLLGSGLGLLTLRRRRR